MTMSKKARTVWFEDGDDQVLHIGNDQRRLRDFGFAAHESELASISATDLRHALIDSADYGADIVVTDAGKAWIHEDVVPHTGVNFGLRDGELVMYVDVAMEYIDDDDELTAFASRLITPVLTRHGGKMLPAEHNEKLPQ